MSSAFHPIDLSIVVLYLIGVAVAGAFFARRNRSLEDYFLGGRRFSGWVMGISMLGTSISSISFLAFPAAAYAPASQRRTVHLTSHAIWALPNCVAPGDPAASQREESTGFTGNRTHSSA